MESKEERKERLKLVEAVRVAFVDAGFPFYRVYKGRPENMRDCIWVVLLKDDEELIERVNQVLVDVIKDDRYFTGVIVVCWEKGKKSSEGYYEFREIRNEKRFPSIVKWEALESGGNE